MAEQDQEMKKLRLENEEMRIFFAREIEKADEIRKEQISKCL
jgi:hypothetical protein